MGRQAVRAITLGGVLAVAALCSAPPGVLADAGTGKVSHAATCGTLSESCQRAVLKLMNADRRAAGLPAFHLTRLQSDGTQGCPGSLGHSVAMAASGTIWHSNPAFPRASFPRNLCVRYRGAAENVGEWATGNIVDDLQAMDHAMMAEPHSSRLCATQDNHACNILSRSYHTVGIGVYVVNGVTWLTEDFID